MVDPAIQTVVSRFEKEKLDGLYAHAGRRFRAARPSQRIDRDFYVDFNRNAIQFHIFPRDNSRHIVIEVTTDPKMDELKTINTSKDYTMEKFNEEVLLRLVGTALENIEALTNKDNGVVKL